MQPERAFASVSRTHFKSEEQCGRCGLKTRAYFGAFRKPSTIDGFLDSHIIRRKFGTVQSDLPALRQP